MSKICILGDTHFGARGDNPHFHRYFKQFYDNVFFPYLEKEGIEYVIQLGDLFDRRKYINFHTLHQAKEYFFTPLNSKYKSWCLVGNHDTYYKNTIEVNSPGLLLKDYNNINKIVGPYETSFDGVSILMVPWICQDNYVEVMNAIAVSKSQICIGHFEINGFEMHKGTVCTDGIGTEIFDKFDLVISGHFHTKSKHGSINYTGTPYEMTWSDYNDPKGFHVLDTRTRELEFIENPYKMFHKFFYDDVSMNMHDILSKEDFRNYKDTIVKVIIKNKTNPYMFDMFIEKMQKSEPFDMQVVEDHLNLNLEDDSTIVSEAEDTLTILSKYVDHLELSVDKQRLESLLRNLYGEALSMETL
jgi:DNA repair exonuclease SbcCD nuclease subunit